MQKFKHLDLELLKPKFDSPIIELLLELNHLRKKKLHGTTPALTFFQLKQIFHLLESIGSARIEGNRTTVAQYIMNREESNNESSEAINEIDNMQRMLIDIDKHIGESKIDRNFISSLHRGVVYELTKEGSKNPGDYRLENIKITGTNFCPPSYLKVTDYMEELLKFINADDKAKYDLLKIAIAHHRFVWVHPFDNGNGRTVRLLTYAMLVKYGFNIHLGGGIVNPSAIFCSNRNKYYENLSAADNGNMEAWCIYMLSGLKKEVEKIDKLLDYDYVKNKILLPAIQLSKSNRLISEIEYNILELAIKKKTIKNSDLQVIFKGKKVSEISRQIKKLLDKKMLEKETDNERKYTIAFFESNIIRGVMTALKNNGFLPENEGRGF